MIGLQDNYYEQRFQRLIAAGKDVPVAVEDTALAYLDSKPALRGKHKVTRAERHAAFWSCGFLTDLPAQA